MKRLHVLSQPTSLKDFKKLDFDNLTDDWRFKVEKLQARRLRQFKQQWD
ncbi:MAG: hypothetical protein ABI220_05200 [Candidatus Saccharimonadales bacterium]